MADRRKKKTQQPKQSAKKSKHTKSTGSKPGKPDGRKLRGRNRPGSPARLKAAERHSLALKMRLRGATYAAIAQSLGYSDSSGAYRAIQRVLHAQETEDGEELKLLENMRLDELQRTFHGIALDDKDDKAAGVVLRVMERRAKLNGLDAPTRTHISGEIGAKIEDQYDKLRKLCSTQQGRDLLRQGLDLLGSE